MDNVTSKDGTTIAFDRLGDGPPVILVSGGSVDRGVECVRSRTSSPGSSRSSTTTAAVEARAATRSRTRSSARSRTSRPSSARPVARRVCTARHRVRRSRSRRPRPAPRSRSSRSGSRRTSSAKGVRDRRPDTASIYRKFVAEGHRGDAVEYFMAKVVGMPAEFVGFAREPAVVAGPGGSRPHARLRRRDHGRLQLPDRSGRQGRGPDAASSPAARASTGWSRPPRRSSTRCRTGGTGHSRASPHDVDADVLGPVLAEFFAG